MEQKVPVQVKDNSPSIERILRPITYTSWLLGVGVAHPQNCSKAVTIIIRIIHITVLSYVTIRYTKYIFKDFYLFNQSRIVYFVHLLFLNCMMRYISTIYYIYFGIRQYDKWPELMDRLKDLDQKIRKEISMNDRSIEIVEALAVFMTFTLCFLWPTVQMYKCIFSYPVNKDINIIYMLFYYMVAQSLINSFVFDVVVYVLYRRFQTLNKLIGQLDKLSDVQWIAFKIRRIRELHADICDLASMVNDVHSLHLLFCSGNCFTEAIISLYLLLSIINYNNFLLLAPLFFYIIYSMQFFLICWICTLACEESNSTGRIIHKIILNCNSVSLDKHEASIDQSKLKVQFALEDSNSEQNLYCSSSHNLYVVENFLRRNLDGECVTKEVNDFSIQLHQNRVAFSACNFFEINNALYGWFVGMIITYLIIILRLYQLPLFNNNETGRGPRG